MSSTEPTEGPFQEHEAFDPTELATEADLSELAEEQAADERAAAGEPAPAEEPSAASGTGLLERALKVAGSDTARYLPVRFVPALTSLLTTPLFTRAITTGDYGAFGMVSLYSSLLAAVAIGWLQQASIRFYWPSKKENRLDGYISTIVWTGITSLAGTAIVVGIAVFFAQGRIDAAILRLVPVALVYFVASFYTTAILQVLRAAKRASAYTRLMVASTIIVTVLSVVFVWYGKWGAFGILAAAALGNLAVAPFALRELAKEGSLSPGVYDRDLLRELIAYGMPLVPASVAGWALVVLDRFVVQWYHGLGQVGIYTVAYTLGDKIMGLIAAPLLLTMMPSLIEAYEKHGQDLAEKVQTQFTRYFAILTLPLLAGMAGAATVFMHVFTAGEYRQGYVVLAVVSAGSMFGSYSQIAGAGLGMHKKTKLIMIDVLIAAGVNLVLNIALVPAYGYVAAGWNTLAAYLLLLVITWWQSRRYMRWIIPWGQIARIAAASVAMGLLVYAMTLYFSPNLILLLTQVAVGIVVYTVLLLVLGGVRPEERAFLGKALSRGFGRRR